MGLLFGCVCLIFGLLLALLIYSVLLRFAVFIANKCLGDSGGGSGRRNDYEDDWDDYDRPRRRGPAIPEPDLGKGMGISFVVLIIQFVIGFALALVVGVGMGAAGGGGGFGGGAGKNPFGPQPGADPTAQLLLNCFSAVIGFVVWCGVLTLMLPTSFGRAALVTLFLYLMLITIGVVIVGIIVVAGVGMGGLR